MGGSAEVTITGPDGASVSMADLPAEVRSEAERFAADDWEPEPSMMSVIDGRRCYDASRLADVPDGEAWGEVVESDDQFIFERLPDDSVHAAYFAEITHSADEMVEHVANGGALTDFEGAQPLLPC